jgi:hypothetical protein
MERFVSDCGRICGLHQTQGLETNLLKVFHKKYIVTGLIKPFLDDLCIYDIKYNANLVKNFVEASKLPIRLVEEFYRILCLLVPEHYIFSRRLNDFQNIN